MVVEEGTASKKKYEDRLAFPQLATGEEKRLFSNIAECQVPEEGFKHSPGSLLGATALVGGTTVGAGILGLPAVTASAGFVPSTVALFGVWCFMAASGLLIAEVTVNIICREGRPGLGLLRVAERAVGPTGARLAAIVYVFLHYALLVAYMAQGGEILSAVTRQLLDVAGLSDAAEAVSNLPQWSGPAAFAAVFGGMFVLLEASVVEAINNALVAVVLVAFFGLLAAGAPTVDPEVLLSVSGAQWGAVGGALPVMFVALVFHNVVGVITSALEADVGKIRIAILAGSFVPFLMFVAWDAVILGSAGTSTASALAPDAVNAPLADPLEALRGANGVVGPLISAFSLTAIITSFVGFVFGLLDFLTDVTGVRLGDRAAELPLYALILAPPLVVAATNPSIFLSALDSAGAFGISLLFGVLPAAMAWKQRYDDDSTIATLPLVPGGRATLLAMVAVAAGVVLEKVLALAHPFS